MRILVVDDEHSCAMLLARVLRRLGHQPAIALDPLTALGALRKHDFDAVITDMDMPRMGGVELALAIRKVKADMPIAFCSGSDPSESAVSEALRLGQVMPKAWNVSQVEEVLSTLRAPLFARGSEAEITPVPPNARPCRRVRIICQSWDQVERLCDRYSSGRRFLALNGHYALKQGDLLTVALNLPDELVLSLSAKVESARTDRAADRPLYMISLTGLTEDLCIRLRAMGRANKRPTQIRRDSTDCGRGEGNTELRRQINELTQKMMRLKSEELKR